LTAAVWVTHQVNITALTGEAMLLGPAGKVPLRTRLG